MNRLTELFEASNSSADYAKNYLNHLVEIVDRLDLHNIGAVMDEILATRDKGGRIFFVGNGGSAATASHFANDIAIGTRTAGVKPFKAISLTDNMAVITALANDEGYDEIFKKQLEVVMEDGDLVVAISASGNSPNIINAVEYAHKRGNRVIGLSGFDGGQLMQMSDIAVNIPTHKGEYGPVEDFHMILDHLFGTYFNQIVLNESRHEI